MNIARAPRPLYLLAIRDYTCPAAVFRTNDPRRACQRPDGRITLTVRQASCLANVYNTGLASRGEVLHLPLFEKRHTKGRS